MTYCTDELLSVKDWKEIASSSPQTSNWFGQAADRMQSHELKDVDQKT